MLIAYKSKSFFPGAKCVFWDIDGDDCTNFETSELLAANLSLVVEGASCTLHGGKYYTNKTLAEVETVCSEV